MVNEASAPPPKKMPDTPSIQLTESPQPRSPQINRAAGWLCLGVAGMLLVSCNSADETGGRVPPPRLPDIERAQQRTTIAVDDSLEIFVMEDPTFSGGFRVRERGDIIIPKLGRVHVAGKSVEAAQAQIEALLEQSQLKDATVIVDRVSKPGVTSFGEIPKMLVYVVGSVNRPGQHMIGIKPGTPVYAYDAVLIAGGLNEFADERHAYILRRSSGGERAKIPLDLRALRLGQGKDIPLGEGDMVFVPQRRFLF